MSATRPAAGHSDTSAIPGKGYRPRATEEEVELFRLRDTLRDVMAEREALKQELTEARQLGAERAERLRTACTALEAQNDGLTRHLVALRRYTGEEVARRVAHVVERGGELPAAPDDPCQAVWDKLARMRTQLAQTEASLHHDKRHLQALRQHVGSKVASDVARQVTTEEKA
jgi:phage shock protein A